MSPRDQPPPRRRGDVKFPINDLSGNSPFSSPSRPTRATIKNIRDVVIIAEEGNAPRRKRFKANSRNELKAGGDNVAPAGADEKWKEQQQQQQENMEKLAIELNLRLLFLLLLLLRIYPSSAMPCPGNREFRRVAAARGLGTTTTSNAWD